MRRRALSGVVLAAALLVLLPHPASAHPLGNFTTNTYAGIVVGPDAVTVDYVVDLAEIPALQVMQRAGVGPGGGDAEDAYRAEECATLASGLRMEVAGEPAPLDVASTELSFPEGDAGLLTLRLECALTVTRTGPADDVSVELRDENFADRLGWREITANGDRMTLTSADVPTDSLSARLVEYPEERLQSPPVIREALVTARAGGLAFELAGAPPAVARTADRAYSSLTGLVAAQELTVGFILLAGAIATGLGALHALAPGHGKTVMAAFLVGQRGATRQALGLGATVAVTHTTGVLLLGLVLTVWEIISPDRIFGWMGVASGLLFTALGVALLRRALRTGRAPGVEPHHGHDHDHAPAHAHALAHGDDHGHDHDHDHGHGHGHGHGHHHHGHGHHHGAEGGGWRSLIVPGLAGGMVPTPSALVVLLGGIALGRTWFGIALVVLYGVGMAATLVGVGYLLVRARDSLARRARAGATRVERLTRRLPLVTASLIILGGMVITGRFALTLGG